MTRRRRSGCDIFEFPWNPALLLLAVWILAKEDRTPLPKIPWLNIASLELIALLMLLVSFPRVLFKFLCREDFWILFRYARETLLRLIVQSIVKTVLQQVRLCGNLERLKISKILKIQGVFSNLILNVTVRFHRQ